MSRVDRMVSRKANRFDRFAHDRQRRERLRGLDVDRIIIDDPVSRVPPYVNPACRWHHGDNHELDSDGWCKRCDVRASRWFRHEMWLGFPKPPVRPWSEASRLSDRFELVRERAWLTALGPKPHGTLAEVQANMPGWAHLFTFHAFTAAWLALPDELDQVVVLDVWEDLNPPAHAWVLPATPSMSTEAEKLTAEDGKMS